MKHLKKNGLEVCFAIIVLLTAAAVIAHPKAPPEEQILLETEDARQQWLHLRGWQVSEPECTSVVIPDQWRTVQGENWLRLQHAQGFSPERYAGQQAEKYIYQIDSDTACAYRAELWLCSNILIGAEVYDAKTQIMQSV